MTHLQEFEFIASPENIDTARLFNDYRVNPDSPEYSYDTAVTKSYNMLDRTFSIHITNQNELYQSQETFSFAVSLFYQHYRQIYERCHLELNRTLFPTPILVVDLFLHIDASSSYISF